MMPSIVHVVDDDPAARESVIALVESMGITAKGYASSEQFLTALEPDQPGCLVTDVRLLGMSGLDLQEELRSRNLSLPVIVITAYADVPLAVRGMRAGAVSVLEKPCREQELWDTIRSALEQDSKNREREATRQSVEKRMASLSPEEREVMQKIVSGIPNKTIATEMNLSLRTVEARRHNVFRKMHVESLAELVRLVVGFREIPEEDS